MTKLTKEYMVSRFGQTYLSHEISRFFRLDVMASSSNDIDVIEIDICFDSKYDSGNCSFKIETVEDFEAAMRIFGIK
jgi:hypothetical protein